MELSKVEGTGVERDIRVMFQVLDSVIPDGEGSYLAAPISTGRRYFALLGQHGVSDLAGLIDLIGEAEYLRLVRWPNVREGEEWASRLRRSGVRNLINTGPIFIQEWDGRDYMKLCLSLIERKVKCAYFHPQWAYSSGAVEELIYCAQRDIRLRTVEDQVLTLLQARSELEKVQEALRSFSCATQTVEEHIAAVDSLIAFKTYNPPHVGDEQSVVHSGSN